MGTIARQTFALDDSAIPLRYQALWHTVHSAQRHALLAARNGTITAAVDHAARKIIKEAGYGQYFTHRLGHGETFFSSLIYPTEHTAHNRHWS